MSRLSIALLAGCLIAGSPAMVDAAAPPDTFVTPSEDGRAPALFSLFEMHRQHGRTQAAEATLKTLDETLPPAAPGRVDLADAYQRMNHLDAAVRVLEKLAQDKGLNEEGRMRLAKLYEATAQPDKALELWRALVTAANTPAQRNLVEDRLLDLAAEQKRLEALAAGLEDRLAAGQGDRNDAILLMKVYIRASAKASAVEVVRKYLMAEGTNVTGMKELARTYRLLGDSAGYEKTYRELMRMDPGHQADYLRDLILDRIGRGGPTLAAELKQLLDELRAATLEKSDAAFEAGVLSMADLQDEAIVAYRQAVARDPANGDNYLLLADLLKKRHRTDEAVALLKPLAEMAASNELFVAAVDGLLNMLTREMGVPLDPATKENLEWTERVVLKRLIETGDLPVLYRLLSDVSQETSDAEVMSAALENSLTANPQLRGVTLRQLMGLSSSQSLMQQMMSGPALPDPQRYLAYGQRLLTLREAMPPEVYIGLGKAMLDRDDPAGAARIFDLATDVSGRLNLSEQTAELFDKAGYQQQALERYRLAVTRDIDNIALLQKLALLKERVGDYDGAHAAYAHAVEVLLAQQPSVVQASQNADARSTRQFRDYYSGLLEGYLRTWPADAARQRAAIESVHQEINEERQRTSTSGDPASLQLHPRLDFLTRFAQRIDLAAGAPGPAPENPNRTRDDRPPSFDEALADAERTGSFDAARSISLISGEPQQIAAIARAIAKTGAYQDAMQWAEGRLDERNLAAVAQFVAERMRHDERAFQAIFTEYNTPLSPFLLRIEQLTGEPLFPASKLLQEAQSIALDPGRDLSVFAPAYLAAHIPPQDMLALLGKYVEMKRNGNFIQQGLAIAGELLKAPLAADTGAGLVEALKPVIAALSKTFGNDYAIANMLLSQDIHPANLGYAREIARLWMRETGGKIDYAEPSFLLVEGKTDAAVQAFVDVSKTVLTESAAGNSSLYMQLTSVFLPAHSAEVKARLDEMDKASGLTPVSIAMREQLFVRYVSGNEQVQFWEHVVSVFPDNQGYLVRLHEAYALEDRKQDRIKVLERLHRLDPDNIVYRAVLFDVLMQTGNKDRAKELNAEGREDMTTARFINGLQAKKTQQGGPALLLQLPGGSIASSALEMDSYRFPFELAGALETREPQKIRNALRAYWQAGLMVPGEQPELAYHRILDHKFQTSAQAADPLTMFDTDWLGWLRRGSAPPRKVFDVLARQDFAIDEFEDYLRAVDDADRDHVSLLYDYLAQAYRERGRADEKFGALDHALSKAGLNEHDFTLWLTLALDQTPGRCGDVMKALEHRLDTRGALDETQLRGVARLYARCGSMQRSADAYGVLAGRALTMPQRIAVAAEQHFIAILSALDFAGEIHRFLDPEHSRTVLLSTLRLTRPAQVMGREAQDRYVYFVLRASGLMFGAEEALKTAADVIGAPSPDWPAANWIELANLQARAGQTREAAQSLGRAVGKSVRAQYLSGMSPAALQQFGANRFYAAILGLNFEMTDSDTAILTARLFPAPADSWSGAAQWLRQAADTLLADMAREETDRSQALEMLAAIVFRMHEAGDTSAATQLMSRVSSMTIDKNSYSTRALTRIHEVSEATGIPL